MKNSEFLFKTSSFFLLVVLLGSTAVSLPEQVDNVTLSMEWNLSEAEDDIEEFHVNKSSDNYYYTTSVGKTDEKTLTSGLVNFGNFLSMEETYEGFKTTSNITQSLTEDSDTGYFLVPFFEGDSYNIEDKRNVIGSGFYQDSNFLDYSNPGFGNTLTEEKIIYSILNYERDDIDLRSERTSFDNVGMLEIRNKGFTDEGATIIEIN